MVVKSDSDVFLINSELSEFEFSEENLKVVKDNKLYKAKRDGFPIFSENKFSLLRIHNEAEFVIKISDDKLKATIDIYPPRKGYDRLRIDDLKNELKSKKISYGLNLPYLEEIVEKVNESFEAMLDVVIAKGTDKEDGVDAKIEYFISTQIDFKPQQSEDGRLDFYNINIIQSVKQDQPLAKFIPHKDGKDGKNIFGEVIKAYKPNKLNRPNGKNTYFKDIDESIIYAKESGSVFITGGKINISKVFDVSENVDFSTGNIDFNGSVRIKGDILSGFGAKVGGNLEVGGCIEDAIVNCEGDVSVKHGFTGKGDGVIRAEGDVHVKYVNNQAIYSKGSILVEKESVNSKLYAKKEIHVNGSRVSIVGGHAIANTKIEVDTIGNEYKVPTIVEVGFDYENPEKVLALEKKHEELKKQFIIYSKEIYKIQTLGRLNNHMKSSLKLLIENKINYLKIYSEVSDTSNEVEKINESIAKAIQITGLDNSNKIKLVALINKITDISIKTLKVQEVIKKLKDEIYNPSKAIILVNKKVYPGSILMINKVKRIIDKEIINKRFLLSSDNEIISV